MPRTFQGRVTLGFVSVVTLTLLLVGPAVILRLDDYFLQQEQINLEGRTTSTAAIVTLAARTVEGPIVTPDDRLTARAVAFFNGPLMQDIANSVAQSDITIQVGTPTRGTDGRTSVVPAPNGTFRISLTAPPKPGQKQDSLVGEPVVITAEATPQSQWAIEVTLSNPYTFRASTLTAVTGLFLVVGLVAFVVSVVVASFLARRFTTPLRRLTTAARDLERGELGSRVPTRLAATGAIEISELSRQFNAMADRLEESVGIIRRDRDRSRDFLADVSHELRTPITALRMSNELLSEAAGDDPDTRAEFLESTRQQLERLDWLAQNLLELSKLDSGLVLLDLRPDDLRAAVESAVEQAQASAARRGLRLGLSLPPNPVRVRHDPQRIGQVVTNLVGNAVKFTPRGGSVEVELVADSAGARIVVRDSGVGIDSSELPQIFDRFFRGTLAHEARASGSGLGLAIVKSIVDLHAGRITVDSGLGSGTTFTVILPRDPRSLDDARSALVDEQVLPSEPGALPTEVADSSPSPAS
ncbi:MAG: HAMP domain-containing histidine kinase [Chloroflexota bacterium]|nr:HAMP domain-containing histidine kinase [Chloroflexota bacterium]